MSATKSAPSKVQRLLALMDPGTTRTPVSESFDELLFQLGLSNGTQLAPAREELPDLLMNLMRRPGSDYEGQSFLPFDDRPRGAALFDDETPVPEGRPETLAEANIENAFEGPVQPKKSYRSKLPKRNVKPGDVIEVPKRPEPTWAQRLGTGPAKKKEMALREFARSVGVKNFDEMTNAEAARLKDLVWDQLDPEQRVRLSTKVMREKLVGGLVLKKSLKLSDAEITEETKDLVMRKIMGLRGGEFDTGPAPENVGPRENKAFQIVQSQLDRGRRKAKETGGKAPTVNDLEAAYKERMGRNVDTRPILIHREKPEKPDEPPTPTQRYVRDTRAAMKGENRMGPDRGFLEETRIDKQGNPYTARVATTPKMNTAQLRALDAEFAAKGGDVAEGVSRFGAANKLVSEMLYENPELTADQLQKHIPNIFQKWLAGAASNMGVPLDAITVRGGKIYVGGQRQPKTRTVEEFRDAVRKGRPALVEPSPPIREQHGMTPAEMDAWANQRWLEAQGALETVGEGSKGEKVVYSKGDDAAAEAEAGLQKRLPYIRGRELAQEPARKGPGRYKTWQELQEIARNPMEAVETDPRIVGIRSGADSRGRLAANLHRGTGARTLPGVIEEMGEPDEDAWKDPKSPAEQRAVAERQALNSKRRREMASEKNMERVVDGLSPKTGMNLSPEERLKAIEEAKRIQSEIRQDIAGIRASGAEVKGELKAKLDRLKSLREKLLERGKTERAAGLAEEADKTLGKISKEGASVRKDVQRVALEGGNRMPIRSKPFVQREPARPLGPNSVLNRQEVQMQRELLERALKTLPKGSAAFEKTKSALAAITEVMEGGGKKAIAAKVGWLQDVLRTIVRVPK